MVMAIAGGIVIRPILQHSRATAVQWRTAPGGRGIPSDGIIGAGEDDREGEAELKGETAEGGTREEDDPFTSFGCGEWVVTELDMGLSLDLEGYVTYRATMYICKMYAT